MLTNVLGKRTIVIHMQIVQTPLVRLHALVTMVIQEMVSIAMVSNFSTFLTVDLETTDSIR